MKVEQNKTSAMDHNSKEVSEHQQPTTDCGCPLTSCCSDVILTDFQVKSSCGIADSVPVQCAEDQHEFKSANADDSSDFSNVQVADDDIDLPHSVSEISQLENEVHFTRLSVVGQENNSEQVVDKRQLKLKYADEESIVKQPLKSVDTEKGDGSAALEKDDTGLLKLDRYLKTPTQQNHQQRIHVYMLHHTGPKQLKIPCCPPEQLKIPSFPPGCESEWTRLATFSKAGDNTPFIIPLARDGFVFDPQSQSVVCFFCKLRIGLSDLDKFGTNLSSHSQCRLKQGLECGNIPVPKYKENDTTSKSINSFQVNHTTVPISGCSANSASSSTEALYHPDKAVLAPSPVILQPSANSLCTDGASLSPGQGASVVAASSKPSGTSTASNSQQVMLSSPPSGSAGEKSRSTTSTATKANKKTAKSSRNKSNKSNGNSSASGAAVSKTATQKSSDNGNSASSGDKSEPPGEKKKLTYADLGIWAEKPKRSDMATLQKRLASFDGKWKSSYAKTPEELAEAGMHYAGYADCARCFFCGGGLKTWEAPDEPWIEHARWFPKCAYIRMTKGAMFVEIVQRKSKKGEKVVMKDVEEEINQKNHVAEARPPGGTNSSTTSARQQPLSEDAAAKDLESLEAEHEELLSEITCKICMDDKSNVVFLPCGHMVACTSCSLALKNCPLCRADIKGSVKAYME